MPGPGSPEPQPVLTRRRVLAGMTGATTGVLATAAGWSQSTPAGTPLAGTPALATPTALPGMTFSDVASNGIMLHVTQIGTGDPILFCHGFPDTSRTWWRHMRAVADAGYRAIAPDMRGYGRSSAPDDANLYTPFDTVGDMVGLLDALSLPTAVIVGHDWGADVAFQAAMMRPDRFPAVFGISGGAYTPRGEVDTFEQLRAAGLGDRFYVFQQIKPEADRQWADAAQSIPSALYWASGLPPAGTAWDPLDPSRGILRPAPVAVPPFADPEYVAWNIAEFQRTGFHGGLNYYRARQPFFARSAAFTGATIRQPSYYITGGADGLFVRFPSTADDIRAGMPGLIDQIVLGGVGHWPQHEASDAVSATLLAFLDTTQH